MSYKEGDRVRIKGIDWYDKHKDEYGRVPHEISGFAFPFPMSRFCGEVVTIDVIDRDTIKIIEDNGYWAWHENMMEDIAWK